MYEKELAYCSSDNMALVDSGADYSCLMCVDMALRWQFGGGTQVVATVANAVYLSLAPAADGVDMLRKTMALAPFRPRDVVADSIVCHRRYAMCATGD